MPVEPEGSLEEAERLANSLCKIVARVVPGISTTERRIAVSVPGLASARLWLLAMVRRREAGYDELIGADLRAIFETVVVSLYALLGGDDAIDALSRASSRARGQLAVGLEWAEVPYASPVVRAADKLPPLEQLCEKVTELLQQKGYPSQDFRAAYEAVYRTESLLTVHPGLDSVADFVREAPNRALWTGLRRVAHRGQARGRIIVAVTLLFVLTDILWRELELDGSNLEPIAHELARWAGAGDPHADSPPAPETL